VLGYGLDGRGFESQQGVGISLHHCVQTSFGAHPSSYRVGLRGSFTGGEAATAWRWSLTFSAKVKNAWTYTFTPTICLQGSVLS
jgi:hypothetical protein